MAGPRRVDFDKFIGWLLWDKGPWFKEQSGTPDTPPANHAGVYAKDVAGKATLYWIDDAGVEHSLAGADAGSIALLAQVFRHDLRLVVRETDIVLTDNTRLDVSTSRHGLVPKATGDVTQFLRADGTYATPSGADFLLVQVFS